MGNPDLQIFDEHAPGATDLLRELHDAILFPSFPPDQYIRPAVVGPADGPALIACSSDGTVVGGALAEWYPTSATLLLAYLAVRPGLRGAGVGRALMGAVGERWLGGSGTARSALVELDDPRHHGSDPGYGDPAARLRFYDRFGVRALAMPYFQPRLSPAHERGSHMLLGVLPAPGVALPEAVAAAPIGAFLREYFTACEGPGSLDEGAVRWLLEGCAGPNLALVPLTESERIPDLSPSSDP